MKTRMKLKSEIVVFLLTVISIMGSLLLSAPTIVTITFILIGFFAYLYSVILSNIKEKQEEYRHQAQAILFNRSGAGNLHYEAFMQEVRKTGKCKNDAELLQRALELEPTNKSALAMLCCTYALGLSFSYNVGDRQDDQFRKEISNVRKQTRKGLARYPNESRFHDALGILYDVEGEHEKARKEFEISGTLSKDFGWRLLMSTSWLMSESPEKAAEEARKALDEGAPKQFVDLYYGKALCAMGDYKEAEPCLRFALKTRGWRPELLSILAEINYMQVNYLQSSKYDIMRGLSLLFVYKRLNGFLYLGKAFIDLFIITTCTISKKLWPFFYKHPKLWRYILFLPSPEQPEVSIANVLVYKKHYKAAAEILQRVCEIRPQKAVCHSNLAICLAGQEKNKEAISACDRAIELEPDNDIFLHNRESLELNKADLIYHGR